MPSSPLTLYKSTIERELLLGNATEHTHRSALKTLLESLDSDLVATNEPKRIRCGAPDFIVTRGQTPLGYVEAKDVGKPLAEVERSEQMHRYRDSLGNLILTDYLEFRWYVAGEPRLSARLASVGKGQKLRSESNGAEEVEALLRAFLTTQAPTVSTPRELSTRMAALARLMRDAICLALQSEDERGSLHHQMEGFRRVLLHDLNEAQFADMYAQTICYGLFAARCTVQTGKFTREHAAYDLPKTNPFLRRMFSHLAGPDLDERVVWTVDDLAQLLNRADMEAILTDFGKRTRQEDPVVHFYETFLAAYDPKMREARGVYYTPEPVVSYIVRSVNHILKEDFSLPEGLADASKVAVKMPDSKTPRQVHRVQILDPATGTGTFLHGVVDEIHASFSENKGMWSGYVRDHLLPRLFGFELLMAPYAVAHMKLGLQLAETGYDFATDERLRVYLTNTLDETGDSGQLNLFAQWLTEEASGADQVKRDAPVMVVLGNPPYSGHSANNSQWIKDLLHGKDPLSKNPVGNYFEVDGQSLGERNPKWLNDDYVKFIRFAQWRIEKTGYGVLAFISNHGYLDNPTFRGMRQSLMQTFDDIYILNLHGNSKKKERSPDGSKDENVFDIQQGVAIGLIVKRSTKATKSCTVRHADLWGTRKQKYEWLQENELATTEWTTIAPQPPHYLCIPLDTNFSVEYDAGWKITEMMAVNSVGIATARDALTIHWNEDDVWNTVTDFAQLPTEEARHRYNLGNDAQDWLVATAQMDLNRSGPSRENIKPVLYRPFDIRFTYYTGRSRGFHCRPRAEVMKNMVAGRNLAIVTSRLTKGETFQHVQATRSISEVICMSPKTSNNGFLFPLYLYPNQQKPLDLDVWPPGENGRRPNLDSKFIADFSKRLGLTFVADGVGDLQATFGPEDVFHYMYAVFHSPAYRSRYAEFLKMDFPRLPLTSNKELFTALCGLGQELVALHLMEKPGKGLPGYPIPGDNAVEAIRYTLPEPGGSGGRVWINKTQYFEGVAPEAWDFHIGGYQVCEKWLKDRKGRLLSYDDLTHYRRTVAALAETITLMEAIDIAIEQHGGWPVE